MAGVPGKNKLERGFRIWWDDAGTGSGTARDLSGDLVEGSCTGGGLVFDQVSMHGVSELVRNYMAGHAEAPVSAQFKMNDTATTGSTTVLNGSTPSTTVIGIGTLTLQWGSNGAAPSTGDPEWEGEYQLVQNTIQPAGGGFVHAVEWRPYGSTAPAWGTVA
jgi:hypothetical protein